MKRSAILSKVKKQWRTLSHHQKLIIYSLCFICFYFLSSQKASRGTDEQHFAAFSDQGKSAQEKSRMNRAELWEQPETDVIGFDREESQGSQDEPLVETNVLQPETPVDAQAYSQLAFPMRLGQIESHQVVHCPNINGGGKNKQCSKGYVDYVFQVKPRKKYYVYVETIAPNLYDNSLWIGVVGDEQQKQAFETCPRAKAGPLVPHKHVKSSRFYCCPKYLTKNLKKGKDEFYYDCCHQHLGPKGDEPGCVLDLEVAAHPLWNMLPRQLISPTSELRVRLYAREDGTSITRLVLSATSSHEAADLP